jgi:hypothetical protein
MDQMHPGVVAAGLVAVEVGHGTAGLAVLVNAGALLEVVWALERPP